MPNIKISIPVTVGGYTGQRDQWEEHTNDYNVAVKDGKVVLDSPGAFRRRITINLEELGQAVELHNEYGLGDK